MSNITISLPDGSSRELPGGSTALDLAASIGSGLRKAAVAASIDGVEADLTVPLVDGNVVALITNDTDAGRHVLRHSTAHVLAQAVTQLYPGAKFTIGPAIENGFYYDFDLPDGKTFTDDDLGVIEKQMKDIVKQNQPFTRSEHSMAEAKELFADQPYKVEIIERVESADTDAEDAGEVSGDGIISAYRNTDEFIDMCVGPHVPSTGKLAFFKLQRVSGSYWRGNEKGPQLQRVYGTAWESKQALAGHLHQLEEALKRDHRKLAVEQDLLSFPSKLGGGLAVWHPKGATIRKLMEDYSRQRHENGGYEFVYTPHLANANLFETSGHLDFYADGHVPADGDGQRDVLPEAAELPDALSDLRQPSAQLSRAAAPTVRTRHRVSLRTGGDIARPDADPRLHAGRQPHLLHAGTTRRRGRRFARLRAVGPPRIWFRRVHVQSVHRVTPRSRSAPTRSGRRQRPRCVTRSTHTAWSTP